MATDELLIQQDLLANEPTFVVLAPCLYDETQGIATQLALAHNEVKRAKREAEELIRQLLISTICLNPMELNKSTGPAYEDFQGLKAHEGFIQELNII
ncbi:hypothetical protein C2G38_2203824 [Gigaspora rosea]|uniref:Uncharacterized protein n=1 Tax=Gigaspora rosea TaxID=44941 RepID=A0A397UR70_9GLOM|nr:hypothetical protein C2G38_2203824 [Gigaspora rosea]